MQPVRMAVVVALVATAWLFIKYSDAQSHVAVDGNARSEYVYRPYPSNPANAVTAQGHVERANNPISGPNSWTWMAVSLTTPSDGDCHSGSTNPNYLKALRAGWMKYNHPGWGNGDQPYMMAAYIDSSNAIHLIKGQAFTQMYPMKVRDWSINNGNWKFQWYNGSSWVNFGEAPNDGPVGALLCYTAGGWASSSSHVMGVNAVLHPTYRSTVTGSTYLSVPLNLPPSGHFVVNSPYWVALGYDPPAIQVGTVP